MADGVALGCLVCSQAVDQYLVYNLKTRSRIPNTSRTCPESTNPISERHCSEMGESFLAWAALGNILRRRTTCAQRDDVGQKQTHC